MRLPVKPRGITVPGELIFFPSEGKMYQLALPTEVGGFPWWLRW